MANHKYSQEIKKALYEGSRLSGIKHSFLAQQYGISSANYVSELIRDYERKQK